VFLQAWGIFKKIIPKQSPLRKPANSSEKLATSVVPFQDFPYTSWYLLSI